MKHYAVAYMRDHTESFKYTRSVLTTLERQCREEIQRLGGNPMLEAIIDVLSLDNK